MRPAVRLRDPVRRNPQRLPLLIPAASLVSGRARTLHARERPR